MIGSSNRFALFSVSTIRGTLCPSIGPTYVIPISSKYIPGTNNCLIESFDFLRIVVNSFPIPGILNKDCSTFPLNSTYSFLVRTLFKYADIPPTFSAIDILLSFRIMIRFFFSLRSLAILFNASYAIPPDNAPSPITATIVSSV